MSQQEKPLVTVLMSCYNAADWLEESITSILQQTYTNFEFLIIDDGSQDLTLDILQRFAAKDDRIVVVKKNNTGLAHSLNVGLNSARGKWIARIDADDICESNRLAYQVEYVLANPDVVFVGSGLILIDEVGNLGARFIYPSDHSSLLNNLLKARSFPPHSSAFYEREAVLSLGGYRGRIKRAEDWDLWLRLSTKGRLASIRKPLVRVRKHSEQISLTGGGFDQIVDCRLSIISYLLKQDGFEDPVGGGDEIFLEFTNWVIARLKFNNYLQYCKWKIKLRGDTSLSTLNNLIKSTLRSPRYSLKLIREIFLGDNFAIKAKKILTNSNKFY